MADPPPVLPIDDLTLLSVEVAASGGEFTGFVRWNRPAVERFRELVGEGIASKLLRSFGADLIQSIEDVLADRTHPPGLCLAGCRHHEGTPTV